MKYRGGALKQRQQQRDKFRRLLPKLLPPTVSINYTDFHNFLGKHALQTSVGKSRLTTPFLLQPSTSQNQPLTIKRIETPDLVLKKRFARSARVFLILLHFHCLSRQNNDVK